MINIFSHNIIALIPVYRESTAELQQTISAFQKMQAGLNIHLVFIVDGMQKSLDSLHQLLGLPAAPVYQDHASYQSIDGPLPDSDKTMLGFHLVVKHQHGGKRDSIALFLQLVMDSVQLNLTALKIKYPDTNDLATLLNKHNLSLFIVDSDTHFAPDALHYLFQTLWHENYGDVYCATPALQGRHEKNTELFRLAQNAEYEIMNYFVLSYLVNGECIASDKLLFGLQACGMLKAAYLMDKAVIEAYGKKAENFKDAITIDMNEDTFLSMLIREKNPKLIYVPKAQASTLFPKSLGNFLVQRKRWRNGNLLQQRELKQQKIRQAPVFKQIMLRSTALVKKIFYSPAAHFFLLMSIFNVAWGDFFNLTSVSENLIFCSLLGGITVFALLFKVSRFPRLYDVLAIGAAMISLLLYGSLILIVLNIVQGEGSGLSWLALMAQGLTPCITMLVMLIKKAERLPLFLGLTAKYILLDPVYKFVFPVYAVAKFDDLSWNVNNEAENIISFRREGRSMKRKALLQFLLENIVIALFLSVLPIVVILTCFAISEILQWIVLLFAPMLADAAQHRPIQANELPQDSV
jgi:cellulose synthase/poly-beta-1,6-N-acetylglucosamine synthase-like glycosyltransferase